MTENQTECRKCSRQRVALLGLVGILLLVLGAVGGWMARRLPPREEPVFMLRVRNLDRWQYPGSKPVIGYYGDNQEVEDIVMGSTQYAVFSTDDDFDAVWAHYRRLCNLFEDDLTAVPHYPGESRVKNDFYAGGRELVGWYEPETRCFDGPKSNAVRARGFFVHSRHYELVGFVYRASGDSTTNIMLTYRPVKVFPRTEWRGAS